MQSGNTTANNPFKIGSNTLISKNAFDSSGMSIPSLSNNTMFSEIKPVVGAITYTANSLGI